MSVTQDFRYLQHTFGLNQVAEMAQAIHDDGFALIPNVLSSELVAQAREKIDGLKPFGFDSEGINDHYKCVFNRDPFWLQFIDWPGVIDLAEATMGSECHIIGQTAWRSHPGHNGWSPHTDRVFVEVPEDMAEDPRFKLPIYLCTAHFYLSDIDEELCPTYVIPGSHKSGQALTWGKDKDPEYKGRKLEPVLCKAGDVLFFRSEIWHTGSENKSDRIRHLLQVHYSHRFIAQQFSPFMSWQFNPEVLAAANPRQLRLMGDHKRAAYD
ncbi:phytanoyl-CoA dioxygenase family protein [Fimbriimonas ginsengisoli]|nr:phytanoyl-CoA dioxygenase family protein [Fimbriimonas ginsengisoli]